MLKVKRMTLVLITGILWFLVSVMLINRAFSWFPEFNCFEKIIVIFVGLAVSFVKTRFVFIKATNKNIDRILNMKTKKVSIFAFHSLKFYILIVLMIGFGAILRNLDFIPKYTIFPVYFGVGIAMLYGSYLYFKKNITHKE